MRLCEGAVAVIYRVTDREERIALDSQIALECVARDLLGGSDF